MTISPTQAAEFLSAHDRYLILTHVRPDGDTVGCAAALCRALRTLGKTAHVLPNPEITPLFSPYLEGLLAPEDLLPDTVVSVDMAARSLFPDNALPYLPRVDLAIDHHPSQEFFARETCLDAGRAACGELMYDILRQLGPVTADIALPLYVAVSTDCGCFVYGNTSADTHRVAAALMDTGIPAADLNKRHFRTKSFRRLRPRTRWSLWTWQPGACSRTTPYPTSPGWIWPSTTTRPRSFSPGRPVWTPVGPPAAS